MSQPNNIHAQKILILDFGSQYTQLIARRVREAGVYCEIWPYDHCEHVLHDPIPIGIILSGGPETVTIDNGPRIPPAILDLNVPMLGICYGMQALALQLGGKVIASTIHEYGYTQALVQGYSPLLGDLVDHKTVDGHKLLDVWMSHGDRVEQLPPDFNIICATEYSPIAGMACEHKRWYGVQFHPEVTHTLQGRRILERFLFDITGCRAVWRPTNIIQDSIERVRALVGNERILLGLSGGVDSSVVAALLHQAVGENLSCVFVDNGLLRLNEGNMVMNIFSQHLGLNITRVDAAARFLSALTGITDPEQKRKVIGRVFIEVFEEEAQRFSDVAWLAQGTIYPDVIESAGVKSGKAHAIKSHHNVGGLPNRMQLKLIEPLRDLFKDEVRNIGTLLGLPHEIVYRHPFPGPGLAVRILGEVTQEYADVLRQADAIFIEELRRANLYDRVSQAFAVFLPVRSVGVVGDARRYEHVICLRAVETIDFMTAHFARLPFDFLDRVSRRIIQETRGISRVVYDVSGKPPATIEWE